MQISLFPFQHLIEFKQHSFTAAKRRPWMFRAKNGIILVLVFILGFTLLGCPPGDSGDSDDSDDSGDFGDSGDSDDSDDSDDDSDIDATCADGPLSEPIADCAPTPVPDSGDFKADCVARINQFRWECQCLPPLERWTNGEACADEHAEYDSTRSAHAGFRDNICSPRGRAQNECPGWWSEASIVDSCLQMMWDEGPGENFNEHGHYINMSNPNYSKVACGIYDTGSGGIWSVQNFE